MAIKNVSPLSADALWEQGVAQNDFGLLLTACRAALDLTQNRMARAVGAHSNRNPLLSPLNIGLWERNETLPTRAVLPGSDVVTVYANTLEATHSNWLNPEREAQMRAVLERTLAKTRNRDVATEPRER